MLWERTERLWEERILFVRIAAESPFTCLSLEHLPPGKTPLGSLSTGRLSLDPHPRQMVTQEDTRLPSPTRTHELTHAALSWELFNQTPSHPQESRQPPGPPYLCPLMKASPPVVLSSPVSILNVVVLPAPLTPSSPKHSPGRTPTHSRSTARMRPILRDLYTWQGRGWGLSTPEAIWTHCPTHIPGLGWSLESPCSLMQPPPS